MKQSFGFNQVSSTTPLWAKWFFRIVFLFTKVIVAYIAATNLISSESKYEITLVLTLLIEPLVFGFSKMFGINSEEEKPENTADDIGGGGIKNPPTN